MGSFFEDFAKIFPEQQSKKGPTKLWVGKDLSESVMDKKLHAPTEEEITRSEAEKDAITSPTIGPISIDPTDYIGPGAFAKVGASLKAAASAVTATPMAVAAFRSANNTMLSREFQGYIKKGLQRTGADIEYTGEYNPVAAGILQNLVDKVSDKEISKYGTPEFAIDKWLHSTRAFGNTPPTGVDTVSRAQVLDETTNVRTWNKIKAEAIKSKELIPEDKDMYENIIQQADKAILKHDGTKLAEDFFLAQKQGKDLLYSNDVQYPGDDLQEGLQALTNSMQQYGLTAGDIKDKSLQQITALVHRKDDEAVKILRKSMEAKNQIISKRTAELFNSQRDPDLGMFVKLQNGKDLAHETDILNHCIGAVDRSNDKYIPAYDTVTGKPNSLTSVVGGTSFANYERKLREGESEFYSYRPKGAPEFTVEIGNIGTGYPKLMQAYGFEDAPLNEIQKVELKKFLDTKGIEYHQNSFGDLNEPPPPAGWGAIEADGPF